MRQMTGRSALAESLVAKMRLVMNAEDSAIEEAVAVVAERAQFSRGPCGFGAPQNAQHAVRPAIRA